MKTLAIIILVMLLVLTGGVALVYSGLFNVAATAHETGVVKWLLQTTRKQSIQSRAEEIPVPALEAPAKVAAGGKAFDEMCAHCHGGPGVKPFVAAEDMNPAPPDLADVAGRRTPAALFWVVKHGIRMTGMPAWGPTHSDAQIWELVAFMRRLPELSPQAYRQLLASASETGHEHTHSHGASPDEEHPHDEDDAAHAH